MRRRDKGAPAAQGLLESQHSLIEGVASGRLLWQGALKRGQAIAHAGNGHGTGCSACRLISNHVEAAPAGWLSSGLEAANTGRALALAAGRRRAAFVHTAALPHWRSLSSQAHCGGRGNWRPAPQSQAKWQAKPKNQDKVLTRTLVQQGTCSKGPWLSRLVRLRRDRGE